MIDSRLVALGLLRLKFVNVLLYYLKPLSNFLGNIHDVYDDRILVFVELFAYSDTCVIAAQAIVLFF